MRHRHPVAWRRSVSAVYCVGCGISGALVGSIGPSINEFSDAVGRDAADVGAVFIAKGVGYMCAVLLSGHVFDAHEASSHRIAAALLAGIAVVNAAVLTAQSYVPLVVCFCLNGVFLGGLDTFHNVCLSRAASAASLGAWMMLMHSR